MDKESSAKNIAVGSTFAVIAVVILTILGELNPAAKAYLTQKFSHHWIAKSALSILFFVLFFLLAQIAKFKNLTTAAALWVLTIVIGLSFLILLAFFFLESF